MQRLILIIIVLSISIFVLHAKCDVSQLITIDPHEHFVARIDTPPASAFDTFTFLGYDICAYSPGEYLDLLLDLGKFQALQQDFPDIRVTQTESQLKTNLCSATKDIPGYRDYQTMLDELLLLQANYPNLVQLVSLGNTWGNTYAASNIGSYHGFNHQIWAVKLSNNVSLSEDEPAFYFLGEHHAREPISMETVMGILTFLVEGYGIDNTITERLNSSEIWFVPLVNPDGHKLVIDQTDVWWRKNIRDNNLNSQINLDEWGYGDDGVDLNRNYGYERGYLSASDDPNMPTYRGVEAFSEPEVQAVRNLLLSRNFVAGISYHTYGQYVLFPYGYMQGVLSPDNTELQALANSMAALLPKINSSGNYTAMPAYALYPANGTLDDWAYGERGIFAYTIEMADEFIPPAEDVPEIVQNNVTAAMKLLDRKNNRILKGHITDAITGLPLRAMVHVVGMDDNPLKLSQYYSDAQFGSYYRLLPEGNYTIKYICPGYGMEQFPVSISSTQQTISDVALLPVESVSLHVQVNDHFGNSISGAVLQFLDSNVDYTTDTEGGIVIPGFLPGAYRIIISCTGYETLERLENITGDSRTFILSSNTIFADDFENGVTAWSVQGSWGASGDAYSGNGSLTDSPIGNYGNNQTRTCRTSQIINLNGAINVNLQFYAKYDIALDGDYCLLAYSTNGTTWRSLASFSGFSGWQHYSYNLNNLSGNPIYLRFVLVSNETGNADGIYIDNLKLFATSYPSSTEDGITPQTIPAMSCYPNPFHGKLHVSLSIPPKVSDNLSLSVYNIKGQRVQSIPIQDSRKRDYAWDARDFNGQFCANGIYVLRFHDGKNIIASAKTILLK